MMHTTKAANHDKIKRRRRQRIPRRPLDVVVDVVLSCPGSRDILEVHLEISPYGPSRTSKGSSVWAGRVRHDVVICARPYARSSEVVTWRGPLEKNRRLLPLRQSSRRPCDWTCRARVRPKPLVRSRA